MSHKKSKIKSAQSTMEYILCCMVFAGVSVGMIAGVTVGMGGFTNANQEAGQQSADRLIGKVTGYGDNAKGQGPDYQYDPGNPPPSTNTGEGPADDRLGPNS